MLIEFSGRLDCVDAVVEEELGLSTYRLVLGNLPNVDTTNLGHDCIADIFVSDFRLF